MFNCISYNYCYQFHCLPIFSSFVTSNGIEPYLEFAILLFTEAAKVEEQVKKEQLKLKMQIDKERRAARTALEKVCCSHLNVHTLACIFLLQD